MRFVLHLGGQLSVTDRHSFIQRVGSAAPQGYETPAFPSLYWPIPISSVKPYYLYNPTDIWRFTTIWTLLFYGSVHLVVAFWACIVQWRNWKFIWVMPIIYVVIGGLEALIAGSVVGGLSVLPTIAFMPNNH
jgi:hypothetical protein